jgi:hypothetical protein
MRHRLCVLLLVLTAAILGCNFDGFEVPGPSCDEQHHLATRCWQSTVPPYRSSYEICAPFWSGGYYWADAECDGTDGGQLCFSDYPGSQTVIPNTYCYYGTCYCSGT